MLSESVQDLSDYLPVFVQVLGENKDVVQIYTNHPFTNQILEDVIHHGLEGSWTVSKAEHHHQWLKQSPVGPKGCLPLISFLDPDIVVPPSDIQLGEIPSSPELLHQLRNQWKWIPVLYCHPIELSVVLNQLKFSILLLDEKAR